jgi:DNA sulfur modification protein DndD
VIFKRIELENFGIFYGSQRLDLGPGLYVLHGENGRGKTTLINAVKWAFFGSFDNRQGQAVGPDLILNRDAGREGEQRFSVTLNLEDDDGAGILVRRTGDVNGGSDAGLYVERNGKPLNQAAAAHLLRDLLEEKVVRFFLFDGEQLREYEELLFESDKSAQEVKRSIEQILGLPVLENAIADLSQVGAELGKSIARSARRNEKTRQQGLQAEQLEGEIETSEAALAALREQMAEVEKRIDEADAVLQKHEAAREVVKQMEAVEAELAEIAKGRETSVADRAEALAGSWVDALFVAVQPLRKELEAEQVAQQEAERDAQRAAQIESSLSNGACDLCEQEVSAAAREALESRLAKIGGTGPADRPAVQTGLLALTSIPRTDSLARARELDERVSEFDVRAASKRQVLEGIKESVQNAPAADIRAAAERRDKAQKELGQIEHLIEGKEEEIAKKRQTHHDIVQRISEGGGSEEMAGLKASERLASELEQLCEATRSTYRDKLRDRVEADASEIYARLTTDPSHSGLRINDSYGLEILGEDGEVVPGRSAGQEQIVALALIGALNRNATRRAPVMMDTPFGRLDKGHRRKVLGFLADMADQVFLLVHSAEVLDTDLSAIAGQITAEYTLERKSAFFTELRPREAEP